MKVNFWTAIGEKFGMSPLDVKKRFKIEGQSVVEF